jgi:hypothetical protein
MGHGKQCPQGEGAQCGTATLSGLASHDFMEQITVGMSWPTIHNSTGDTELTINVGNFVAKITKSNIIESL